MSQMFGELYPDAAVPKRVWQWIETAQSRLVTVGVHRALSAVDLLICGTAAGHSLIILHDDNDFVAAARHLPDVRERRISSVPPTV
jgi:predicted nuclease of predicted toxin-antitoxin system